MTHTGTLVFWQCLKQTWRAACRLVYCLADNAAAAQRSEGGIIPQCAIVSHHKINIRQKGNKGKEN